MARWASTAFVLRPVFKPGSRIRAPATSRRRVSCIGISRLRLSRCIHIRQAIRTAITHATRRAGIVTILMHKAHPSRRPHRCGVSPTIEVTRCPPTAIDTVHSLCCPSPAITSLASDAVVLVVVVRVTGIANAVVAVERLRCPGSRLVWAVGSVSLRVVDITAQEIRGHGGEWV